jgi:prepilin-type N-terminal cleavage/methylation domain-containing protein
MAWDFSIVTQTALRKLSCRGDDELSAPQEMQRRFRLFVISMPGQNVKPDNGRSVAAQGSREGARIVRPFHRLLARRGRGFTLIELLVVMAILVILLALMLGALARARASASAVACCANLRQIGMAFAVYAGDHAGKLPDPQEAGVSWETSLRLYNSKILRCPADEEIFSAVGSSYDWRDTGDPYTTLAGRTIIRARSDAVLAFETLPGWHNLRQMNAVRVDGSALVMEAKDCLGDLQLSPCSGK